MATPSNPLTPTFYYQVEPVYTDIALAIGEPAWFLVCDYDGRNGGHKHNDACDFLLDPEDLQFVDVYKLGAKDGHK